MDKLQKKKANYWYIALGLLVAANTLLFAVNALSTHNTLNTFGFDLGIQHQATWLLSRFKNPFVTVNGLHFFAGHSRFISVLTAPFLWIWQDARMMLLLQSFSLTIAAVPLFLIANKKLGSSLIAIIVVISYFLYPELGHLNMENFHYDSFLVLFIFCAFYFLTTKRYFLYIAFVILALITKEEAAITIFLLGIYAFFQDKNIGVATMLLPAIYVAVLLNLIFPIFVPEGYALYSRLRIGEVFLSDPFSFETYKEMYTILMKNLFTDRNGTYLLQIFYPVAFIPLLSPATMLVAGSLYINLLSDYSYAHSIKYHYVAGFIPFIFISIVYVLSYLTEGKAKKLLLPVIIVIIAASVTGNSLIGSKTRLRDLDEFPKRLKVAMTPQKELEQLIDSVPGDATISATYNVVPHLTDRVTIFQFPNPFKRSYWSLSRKAPYTDVKYVDYVLLDTRREKDYDAFESLKDEGVYVVIQRKGPFRLYKYVENGAPDMVLPGEFYSSGELSDTKLLNEDITRSIATGVSNRVIYVDTRIGVKPSGLELLRHSKNNVHTYTKGFMDNRNLLFNSGLLVMQYAIGRPEPTETEYEVLRQFIANGGRILLLCPAWVWTSYDKKTIDQLPYARIAKNFGLQLEARYVKPPMKIVHPDFKVSRPEEVLYGTFSPTEYQ
ncbi:MAG: DUF2079 domain-containing protein, partial [Desulfobacterales bacterium]|nr:DUF2079 domain-containing protein [Desulfobacterales bacterium]